MHKHLLAAISLSAVWALAGCSCGKGQAFSQFASPAEGALVRGAPIEISGTATAKDSKLTKVEVSTDDGATWADAAGTSSWTYGWAGAADGAHTLRSRAHAEGGVVEESPPAIHVIVDNTPPSAAVTSASSGQILVGSSHALAGTAEDANGVARVEVSFDQGATWTTATGTISWSYDWTPLPADGAFDLYVRATDRAGNVSTALVFPVVIDRELPSSAVTSPSANAFLTGGTVTVTGTASSTYSTIDRVEVSTDDGATWVAAIGTSSWTYDWTLPADGNAQILVRAADVVGGLQAAPTVVPVVVDQSLPSASFVTPAGPMAVNGASLHLEGTAADPVAGDGTSSGLARVELSIDDGASWTSATGTGSWTFEWTLPSDGTYLLRTRAVDLAGNTGNASASITIVVDNALPSSAVTSPSDGTALPTSSAALSGTATDALSGIERVEVSIDGGAWLAATGTTSWTYDFSPGADGVYSIRTRAVDVAGNVELPGAARTLTLDTTRPTVVTASPTSGQLVVGTQATVSGTAADALGLAAVELSLDGGNTWVFATGTSSWTYDWNPLPPDGPFDLRVRSVDRAGNTSVPQIVSVIIDRELPASSISSPVADEFLKDAAVNVQGTAQSTYSTVATVDVSTDDGVTWSAAAGTTSWTYAWTPVVDGAYHLKSRARDVLGGYEAMPGRLRVVVDQTPPSSNVTSPAAPVAVRGSSYTLQGTASDPVATDGTSSQLNAVEVSTDDGATWIAATGTSSWSLPWTLPADGIYLVRSRATDVAGNVGAPGAAVALTVDNTEPTADILSPGTGAIVAGSTATVTGNASDALSGVVLVEISANDGPWIAASGTTSWTYGFTPGSDGLYSLRARATDAAGNVSAPSAPRIFTLDGTVPSCQVTDPADGQAISGTLFLAAGVASDATAGVERVEFSSDDGLSWSVAAGSTAWTYNFTPASSGTYYLRCRAFDRAGNEGVQAAANVVTVDTSSPWSRITSPVTGEATNAASYAVLGTAGSGAATITQVEVSTDNGATWQLATGTTSWSYAWTSVAEGTYTLRARARNDLGAVEQSSPPVTITFDRTAPTSAATSPPSGSSLRGTTATIGGIASDALSGVAAVEISFDDGATFQPVTSGTGLWSYTWTLPADGTYSVRTRATDRAGNVESAAANIILTVDNTEPATVISVPAPDAVLRGATATLSGTASDGTGSGISRVEISTDGGATWTAAAGGSVWSYSWTLPADGTYAIQARALDVAGNLESAGPSVPVRVDNTAPASAIADPLAGANLRQATYTLLGTAADVSGSGVARVEVSTNGGSTWSTASGTTSWTYAWTTPGDGLVTLRSRAVDVAGNTEAPGAGVQVRIDKTAPATTIVSPNNGANVTGTQATVSGLVVEGGSGVQSVEVSTNGGATWSAVSLAGSSWTYTWTLPADGSYTIRSRATDVAGNVETPQAGNAVKVDNTAPTSAITAPANGSGTNLATYTITGTYSDGAGSGVQQVEVSTDNGVTWVAATLGPPGTWSYAWNTGPDGSYTLRSRATDNVGLVETPGAGNTVSVDRTGPVAVIVSPANGTGISTLTQIVGGTASDGTGSGVVLVEISLDNGATWANATGTTSWSYPWTLPADPGSYAVQARAVDLAGNVQAPVASFTYGALPNISALVPASAAAGTAVSLAGYRFGSAQGISTVTFNGLGAGTALSWAGGLIRLPVPGAATTGNVVVTANSLASLGVAFTVLAQPASGTTGTAGGKWTSIKLGPDGLPRISHANATETQVLFTSFSGGAWTTGVVETATGGANLRHTSLAVDSNGVNHLAYNVSTGGLRYAFCTAGCDQTASWTVSTIASGAGVGQYPAIALDSAGLPHIACYDASTTTCGTAGCARYASYGSPSWTLETIDNTTGNNVGQYISLAIDSADRPHAAFYDAVNRNLVYAYKASALWGSVSLATTDRVGQHTSIALNGNLPRVAFTNDTTNALNVSFYDGATWAQTQVDLNVDGRQATVATSIAVGNDGRERVVYYSTGLGALRYATWNPSTTTWTATTAVTGAGAYCSGTLDALNRVRASYLGGGNLGYYAQP